ncbi:polysaccharide lyase family 8 super-sandwich domain-containing protein [Microbispora hainanensis]|uniref:Polysaccharide lyase 8 family protein n=1 Tax=Microbispora hainanensis TaxID=568844 RepID=A0A544YM21_9ACTN|nr:polysaccharide lyase family 8 super-sandwich domain-containing protein [Microbispora hainanensis]TQS17767.1 hypothetical protein FLX08_27770 [Microbispora hainanensis]
MNRPSRRLFLQLGGLAVLTAACVPRRKADAGTLTLLRRRWREVTLGHPGAFDPEREPYRTRLARLGAQARRHRDTMTPTARSLWPDLPFPSLDATPARLRAMARAYALPGTGLTAEPGLGTAVAAGIEHYVRHVYAADAEQTGNWWDWQIGTPRALLDAAVLAAAHLTDTQVSALCAAVDAFVPESRLDDYEGNSTGANRVDLCTVTLLRAIAGADPDRAALAVSALSPVFPYVAEGDGFHRDGWHTGSGMLYWWARGHGDHYSDAFWPTVDPYRLPGTTVSTRRLPDGAGGAWGDTRTPAEWAGGATDGTYAAVGQHLYGLESTLEAFTSWFFLDDAVVCLGAGITCRDGVPVETVVDNRRTGARLTAAAGWAHLDGHGGYVVPAGQPLRTLREDRTAAGVTRAYTTLWLDHGVDPDGADYVYHLMPGAGPAETAARAADPGWARVLANTSAQQGIEVASLGVTAVNFWTGGRAGGRAGGLTASDPCAVLVRDLGDGTATVTVADPRRALDELAVTWDRPVAAVTHGHPLLERAETGARLTLTFAGLADHEGASCTITVRGCGNAMSSNAMSLNAVSS